MDPPDARIRNVTFRQGNPVELLIEENLVVTNDLILTELIPPSICADRTASSRCSEKWTDVRSLPIGTASFGCRSPASRTASTGLAFPIS